MLAILKIASCDKFMKLVLNTTLKATIVHIHLTVISLNYHT